MLKHFLRPLTVLAILAATSGSLPAAEEPLASAAELTLRVDDTITWTPTGPHKVRFGGTVMHNGVSLPLTPFVDVQRVLTDITPALTPDANGVATTPGGGVKVTAKVKADTGTPAITEFFFTCGFAPHSNAMVAASFKIAPKVDGEPPRNIQIVSASDSPLRWVLQTTPGDVKGDRSLRRP